MPKGRNGYYHYYHCTSSCGRRFKAQDANRLFVEELGRWKLNPVMAEVCKYILTSEYGDMTKYNRDERTSVLTQINTLTDRLNKARQKMFMDLIDPFDFKLMANDREKAIEELERRLVGMTSSNPKSIDNLLKKGLDALMSIDTLYENGSTEDKRNIIGSIFPENLIFDGIIYRTEGINEAVRLIYLICRKLKDKKTVQVTILSTCTVR